VTMNFKKLRVVHYLNQFFGQVGGEDKANFNFLVKEGPIGPGMGLQKLLGEKGEVLATAICGDNYFAENLEKAVQEGIELVTPYEPDLFFAGPAFEAGRYGMSCGAICKIVHERLGIPAITGMYIENPGVDLYRRYVYICKTGRSAAKMLQDLEHMVDLGLKLIVGSRESNFVSGEGIASPRDYEFFPRGILRNQYTNKTASERGIDMLLAKIKCEPFQTEAEVPKFAAVKPPAPIKNLNSSEIALISDGGLTRRGNPDKFNGRGDNSWAAYEIKSFFPKESSASEHEIVHTGYSPVHVMKDTNRLVPIDVMQELEGEGVIKKLHPFFYSTSGNAASQECCESMGREIGEEIKNRGVDAAILTST
jgi:betaine reductase